MRTVARKLQPRKNVNENHREAFAVPRISSENHKKEKFFHFPRESRRVKPRKAKKQFPSFGSHQKETIEGKQQQQVSLTRTNNNSDAKSTY